MVAAEDRLPSRMHGRHAGQFGEHLPALSHAASFVG
jgi:hypothetical protein